MDTDEDAEPPSPIEPLESPSPARRNGRQSAVTASPRARLPAALVGAGSPAPAGKARFVWDEGNTALLLRGMEEYGSVSPPPGGVMGAAVCVCSTRIRRRWQVTCCSGVAMRRISVLHTMFALKQRGTLGTPHRSVALVPCSGVGGHPAGVLQGPGQGLRLSEQAQGQVADAVQGAAGQALVP